MSNWGRAYLFRTLFVLLAVSMTLIFFHFKRPRSIAGVEDFSLCDGIGLAVVAVIGLIVCFFVFRRSAP
jgi:hypothetical protein